MRKMECEDCGCNKSLHRMYQYNGGPDRQILCFGCWEIYRDNRSEYFANELHMWHKFRMDNLKWLEQIVENKAL